MPDFQFAIESGFDLEAPANVETVVELPPNILEYGAAPLYHGHVLTRLGSGLSRRDGHINHAWHWDILSSANYNALIYHVFGNFTTASKPVTIVTIAEDFTWRRYNAYAVKPYPNEDYTLINSGWLRNLRLRFNKLSVKTAYLVDDAGNVLIDDAGNITLGDA